MKAKFTFPLASVFLFAGILVCYSQESSGLYSNLISFEKDLEKQLWQLSNEIDRQRLVLYLRDFGRSISNIIADKGEVATELSRSTVNKNLVIPLAERLQRDVEHAKQDLNNVRFLLQEKLDASAGPTAASKAAQAANDLDDVFQNRKIWVDSLLRDLKETNSIRINFKDYANEAEKSKEALQTAQTSLSHVVAILNR